jgi:hypothetical protein
VDRLAFDQVVTSAERSDHMLTEIIGPSNLQFQKDLPSWWLEKWIAAYRCGRNCSCESGKPAALETGDSLSANSARIARKQGRLVQTLTITASATQRHAPVLECCHCLAWRSNHSAHCSIYGCLQHNHDSAARHSSLMDRLCEASHLP